MRSGRGSNRSSATANVTLYCTRRPSGLTIGHGQGQIVGTEARIRGWWQNAPSLGSTDGEVKHLPRVQQPLQFVHQSRALVATTSRVDKHQQRPAAGTRHRLHDERPTGAARHDKLVSGDARVASCCRRTPPLPHRRFH